MKSLKQSFQSSEKEFLGSSLNSFSLQMNYGGKYTERVDSL